MGPRGAGEAQVERAQASARRGPRAGGGRGGSAHPQGRCARPAYRGAQQDRGHTQVRTRHERLRFAVRRVEAYPLAQARGTGLGRHLGRWTPRRALRRTFRGREGSRGRQGGRETRREGQLPRGPQDQGRPRRPVCRVDRPGIHPDGDAGEAPAWPSHGSGGSFREGGVCVVRRLSAYGHRGGRRLVSPADERREHLERRLRADIGRAPRDRQAHEQRLRGRRGAGAHRDVLCLHADRA